MFCKNCGKKIKLEEGATFCGSCGTPVDNVAVVLLSQEKGTIQNNDDAANGTKAIGNQKRKTVFDKVVYWGSAIVGFIVAEYAGLVAFLMFFIACLIGLWFSLWYLKREKINQTLLAWIAWSNVLTWLLPPLGIMTGIATFVLSNASGINRRKYIILAIVCIALAILNAILGATNALNQ